VYIKGNVEGILRIHKDIYNDLYLISRKLRIYRKRRVLKNSYHSGLKLQFIKRKNTKEALEEIERLINNISSKFSVNIIADYKKSTKKKKQDAIDAYRIPPYTIRIYSSPFEKKYVVNLGLTDSLEKALLNDFSRFLLTHDFIFFKKGILEMSFEEIVEHRRELAQRLAPLFLVEPWLKQYFKPFIAKLDYAVYRSLSVERLMPFLLDENIQEIFCDRPGTRVYLDHISHGRLVSNIKLTRRDYTALLHHLVADRNIVFDNKVLSIKTDFATNMFHVRVSIDLPPLAVDGGALDIRRYKKKWFKLQELVKNGFISLEGGTFLLLAALARANIIISGEPGTGKTTLLNALDMMLPSFLRRLYVEDVVESVSLIDRGAHQLRLRVSTLEEVLHYRQGPTKYVEIVKALHRKPDYLILGELQTRRHFKAAFHAMSSGLRVIATCHSRGFQELILRLTKVYGFPRQLLDLIDVVVITSRSIYQSDRKFVKNVFVNNGEFFEMVYTNSFLVKDFEDTRLAGLLEEQGLNAISLGKAVRKLFFDFRFSYLGLDYILAEVTTPST
ncbi:MAG: type II/IV secretion system ATPase subunit, partial [Thermoproteales archaeon]|nr:type II/IV secretion system ATPase subunit [Thermoproteales archaeon]